MAQLQADVRAGRGVHDELRDLAPIHPAQPIFPGPYVVYVNPVVGLVEYFYPPFCAADGSIGYRRRGRCCHGPGAGQAVDQTHAGQRENRTTQGTDSSAVTRQGPGCV